MRPVFELTDCSDSLHGEHTTTRAADYNRYRYYDPSGGRFASRDPIGLNGGLNYHAYAPNPTGWTDSLGLTPASFAANVARIKAGQSVTVCSYKEAQALLFGAFPDAQKSARRR